METCVAARAAKRATVIMVILNDVLDFSKIDAGKLNIEAVQFPVLETNEVLVTLRARAEKKGCLWTWTTHPMFRSTLSATRCACARF
jgi:signal transduction histidine kinase